MTNHFSVFYNTLNKENIDLQKIPQQFYAQNFEQFFQHFHSYVNEKKLTRILIFVDGVHKKTSPDNPEDICQFLLSSLQNIQVECVDLSKECSMDAKLIHASEFFLEKCQHIISNKEHFDAYISLGSGSLTDLIKHALFQLKKENSLFLSIPTATTVTAFTSAFSVVDIQGAKKTRTSRTIDCTFWIEPLLKAAPMPLLKAGFGDLLARFVALADWYLGNALQLSDDYNELPLRLMEPFNSFLKAKSAQGPVYLLEEMPQFAETLAMAGISMSLCNQTTPLSGYEHTISHSLDFLRLTSQKELVLHGEQVALSCLTSAMSYDWLLQQNTFDEKKFRTLNEIEAKKLIQKLLEKAPFSSVNEPDISQLTELFLSDYLTKSNKWDKIKTQFQNFMPQWPEVKNKLQHIVIDPKEMENILMRIQLPDMPENTNPPTSSMEFRWAIRFAPFIRSRFCLADFLFWIGEDPCAIAAL